MDALYRRFLLRFCSRDTPGDFVRPDCEERFRQWLERHGRTTHMSEHLCFFQAEEVGALIRCAYMTMEKKRTEQDRQHCGFALRLLLCSVGSGIWERGLGR